jgi:hypothetical protein
VIFVETHCYALGCTLGLTRARAEFERQVQSADEKSLPCARTIQRLRSLDEVQLWYDVGSTRLAESRSRAVHEAVHSQCDLYFSCDDDCEANLQALEWMIEAVHDRPAVCIAPYWRRLSELQGPKVCVNLPEVPEGDTRVYRMLSGGGMVTMARNGGMGLVCASMQALRRIVEANSQADMMYTDLQGVTRCALFMEYIKDGAWLGEDVAFFSRIPRDVSLEALMTGLTSHAGEKLDLSVLQTTREELEALLASQGTASSVN